ncbi:MAG: hypothetical protein RIT45_3850 [Pseudomonadota bacterium]|jgi:soluble lytic murein transglycosylase-like protein
MTTRPLLRSSASSLPLLLALATGLVGCGGTQRRTTTAPPTHAPPRPAVTASARPPAPAVVDEGAVEAIDGSPAMARGRAKLPRLNAERAERCSALREPARAAARRHALDPATLLAIAWVESGFAVGARSSAGARGPMQLLPATARAFGCDDPQEDDCALEAAAAFLARLLQRFDGVEIDAIAAYNTGATRVARARRAGRLPPNQWYVERVLAARALLRRQGCREGLGGS